MEGPAAHQQIPVRLQALFVDALSRDHELALERGHESLGGTEASGQQGIQLRDAGLAWVEVVEAAGHIDPGERQEAHRFMEHVLSKTQTGSVFPSMEKWESSLKSI